MENGLDWRAITKELRSQRQKFYRVGVKGGRKQFKLRMLDVGYSTTLYALLRAIIEVEKLFKMLEKHQNRVEIRYDKETDSPYLYAVRDHSAGRNRLGGNR